MQNKDVKKKNDTQEQNENKTLPPSAFIIAGRNLPRYPGKGCGLAKQKKQEWSSEEEKKNEHGGYKYHRESTAKFLLLSRHPHYQVMAKRIADLKKKKTKDDKEIREIDKTG